MHCLFFSCDSAFPLRLLWERSRMSETVERFLEHFLDGHKDDFDELRIRTCSQKACLPPVASAYCPSVRLWLAGMTAIALATFVLPASAAAATRYVSETGSDTTNDCAAAASPCLTVQHAADQAASGDTVEIAAGTYVESVVVDGKVLTFVGEGSGTLGDASGATIVRGEDGPPDTAGAAAFELPSGGELRSLRAEGGNGGPMTLPPPAQGGRGILYQPVGAVSAELNLGSVVVIGGAGTFPALGGDGLFASSELTSGDVGLEIEDSVLAGGSGLGSAPALRLNGGGVSAAVREAVLDATAPTLSPALVVLGGASATVEESSLKAATGASAFGGTLEIHRSTIEASVIGIEARQFIGQGALAEIHDSLVIATGIAVQVQTSSLGDPVSLIASGSTFAGGGSAAMRVERGGSASPATANLRNSIVHHSPFGGGTQVDLLANGGTIDADFSSFTHVVEENGGSAPAPGSASNVAGAPEFADAEGGDYSLQLSSPLIDAGDPAIVGPGQLDLAGASRSLDGNGDCIVAPDIGALELTGHESSCPQQGGTGGSGSTASSSAGPAVTPPNVPPTVLAFAKRGNRFAFSLSEPSLVTIFVRQRKRDRRALEELTSTCGEHRGGKCPTFRQSATLRAQKGAGPQSIRFADRLKGGSLEPGRYAGKIVAVDQGGLRSKPRWAYFRIP
jgi:hypothetical protein